LGSTQAPAEAALDAGGPEVNAAARAGDALFRPVRTGNAFEETVERLLTAIKLGIAAPGTRLPSERELADRLSVSRVTLREAIRALRQSGYVESRRGRYGGTFVNVVLPRLNQPAARRLAAKSGRDLDDTLALRQVLEVGAAEQAARSGLDEHDAGHLTACLHDCADATDPADYRRLDSRLHLAIAEVTGSPSLTAAVADVRMRINRFLDAIPPLERNMAHSEAQHRRIVTAILADDVEAARRAMAEHLLATAALLRGFLS
jgi:DNA-binding FadR family transcriptional regulator